MPSHVAPSTESDRMEKNGKGLRAIENTLREKQRFKKCFALETLSHVRVGAIHKVKTTFLLAKVVVGTES